MILKNYYGCICFISLIILLFIFIALYLKNVRFVESFDNKNINIVLAGDSIFDNKEYVILGESVEQNLKNNGHDVLLLAKDGAFVADLVHQLEKMPSNLNTPDTRLFISVGGNDILYKYRDTKFIDEKEINSVLEQYKNNILSIKNRFNIKIYLTNIYYPPLDKYVRLHKVIRYWNNEQKKFAKKNNISLFNIDTLVTEIIHFSNEIEPSEIGSKLIADGITNII
tara:strand:+ start:5628 stop:6302 length:675 start_codon:yes stop_codon:yes gene_type:complete